MKSGAAHGAQPEDIYGCLYFHLSDQLREFRQRIRTKFPTSFRITSLALTEWAVYIREARPPHVKSDRIDVGDNMDHDRSGTKAVLPVFAPLLSPGKDSAIVGYYKSWPKVQRDGRAKGANEKLRNMALGKVVMDMRVSCPLALYVRVSSHPIYFYSARRPDGTRRYEEFGYVVSTPVHPYLTEGVPALGDGFFFSVTNHVDLGYDNSKPFEDYLKKQGLDEVLQKTGLKLREAHRIVPHVRPPSTPSADARSSDSTLCAASCLGVARSVGYQTIFRQ
jgi:hypothetical protein